MCIRDRDYTLTQQAAELFWRNGTHRIALTGDFAAGSSVHIDAGAELVEINGYNAMRYLTYDSRFFSLAPGENTVYGPGGTIDVYKRQPIRWTYGLARRKR